MQIAVTNEIFIVDGDASVRAVLSVVLSSEGYQVASFVEGETFLAAARSRTPGCVLLDVHLPGSSGLEVLKQLDAQSHPAPVLVLAVSKRS
jgi:FixJ family two-component response regulator